MERILYAICPRCGMRANIIRHIWSWEEYQDIVLVKCACGRSQLPYDESRVLKVDLDNPYMKEEHFDLLVPPGWTYDRWEKIIACIPRS